MIRPTRITGLRIIYFEAIPSSPGHAFISPYDPPCRRSSERALSYTLIFCAVPLSGGDRISLDGTPRASLHILNSADERRRSAMPAQGTAREEHPGPRAHHPGLCGPLAPATVQSLSRRTIRSSDRAVPANNAAPPTRSPHEGPRRAYR